MDLHAATIVAYRTVGIASDRLPYSPNMLQLCDHLRAIGYSVDYHTVWCALRDLRKRNLLPHVGRGPNNRQPLPPADVVNRCYLEIGIAWDRLPYTADMDRLVAMVREATGLPYTHWQVWWRLLDSRKRNHSATAAAERTKG